MSIGCSFFFLRVGYLRCDFVVSFIALLHADCSLFALIRYKSIFIGYPGDYGTKDSSVPECELFSLFLHIFGVTLTVLTDEQRYSGLCNMLVYCMVGWGAFAVLMIVRTAVRLRNLPHWFCRSCLRLACSIEVHKH